MVSSDLTDDEVSLLPLGLSQLHDARRMRWVSEGDLASPPAPGNSWAKCSYVGSWAGSESESDPRSHDDGPIFGRHTIGSRSVPTRWRIDVQLLTRQTLGRLETECLGIHNRTSHRRYPGYRRRSLAADQVDSPGFQCQSPVEDSCGEEKSQ